jgi:hypothetical protein
MAGCVAMLRRSTLLICLLALALPVTAQGQNPSLDTPPPILPPVLPSQTQQPQTATVPDSTIPSTTDGGLATWQEVLIFTAGGLLLLGIAWAIVKDARQVAVGDLSDSQEETRSRREVDIKRRKAKNRAAAKRSRAARRRNR